MDSSRLDALCHILAPTSASERRKLLAANSLFCEEVLGYENRALKIFRQYLNDYRELEAEYSIPYRLQEDYKLYAVDALVIAKVAGCTKEIADALALIFTAFYVAVHYYDDNVEHPDKFFSKFDFSHIDDQLTQKGAAPFSFLLSSQILIKKYLENPLLGYSNKTTIQLMDGINKRLLSYTPYFTHERHQKLTTSEVLQLKQHEISGSATMLIADLIEALKITPKKQLQHFKKGIYLIGSLAQITDDVRDASVDAMLRNANLFNTLAEIFGEEQASPELAKLYLQEETVARQELSSIYSKDDVNLILSIPFYPFLIDKSKLARRG